MLAQRAQTVAELAAKQELGIALNSIIVAARDKYPKGSAERASYGLGGDIDGAPSGILLDLVAYVFGQLSGTAPKDTLPGLKPAEIALLGTLQKKYKDADWA